MRFRQRHVHATIVKHISKGLGDFGWYGTLIPQVPVNFGASPVVIMDYEPQQAGETPAPNTVAISIDHQGKNEAFELGGLQECEYTVFIDIYGENESIGISIADDVKDLISDESMPVLDFTSNPEGDVSDLWLEFEDVIVEKIPGGTSTVDKRSWRAVKATAVCFF
jgi:hypothetical protein